MIQKPNAALSHARLGAPACTHGSNGMPILSMAGGTDRVRYKAIAGKAGVKVVVWRRGHVARAQEVADQPVCAVPGGPVQLLRPGRTSQRGHAA